MPPDSSSSAAAPDTRVDAVYASPESTGTPPVEDGGPAGPEPTRFGDWERKGRCIDF